MPTDSTDGTISHFPLSLLHLTASAYQRTFPNPHSPKARAKSGRRDGKVISGDGCCTLKAPFRARRKEVLNPIAGHHEDDARGKGNEAVPEERTAYEAQGILRGERDIIA